VFEFRRQHRYVSVVSVECCRADHSARGVLMSVVSEYNHEASIMRGPGPLSSIEPYKKYIKL
jgi:hypothetical protein